MIRTIYSLPPWLKAIAVIALIVGLLATVYFIVRYVSSLPWFRSEEGRHLMSWTANVGGFFLIYTVQVFIRSDWSWRPYLIVAMLLVLVSNCVWRVIMLERYLRRRRQRRRADALK